jgi:hypothetical protein
LLLPLAPALGQSDPAKAAEQAASDWIRVRSETARIQTEWNSERPLLISMVDELTARAVQLEGRRDLLLAKTAKDRQEASDLEAESRASAADLRSVESQLRDMDGQLAELRPALPPRLSEALALPYKSLAEPGLSINDRMQLTTTVINRCIQFDRSITSEQEALDPDGGGNPRMLEVIYWGLGHGYALDRAAGKAWYGSPAAGSWKWEPIPDGAGRVAELVDTYEGKEEPRFVEVPARLGNPSAQTQP